jgi:surfactin synthase thioesterase subunit
MLRQIFLPVIRGDLMAHSRYRPAAGSVVDCQVVALTGTTAPVTNFLDVRAWERHISSPLRVHELPGGTSSPTGPPKTWRTSSAVS